MKRKARIISFLLGLVMIAALLPMTAFADTAEIKTVAVTVSGMEWGKPRPGIGSFSVADSNLQISNITWTANDEGKVTYYNRVIITVDIKSGVDAKFVKETSIKASVNGDSSGIVKKRKSDTQMTITYTINVANPNAEAEKAALQAAADAAIEATKTDVQSYDTFDYRAYANVYPDVKAAYGYDAQKLWAHYVNYGKAEGRVASYINAAGNPKTGATYYKNANTGTTYTDTTRDANVPATYLDPLPPSNYDVVQNWYDHQLTQPQSMSNAKLVAEWLRLHTLLENKETGFSYPLVTMHRYWDIAEEIGIRAKWGELLYCYENNVRPKAYWRSSDVTYERIQEVKNGNPSGAEWQRLLQTDYLILIHWMYGFHYGSSLREDIFPTPPADPGTAGGTSTPTTPAKPAGPAVSLTKQNLTVNGAAKNTEIYNIDGSNYFKLRDMAALLNGTTSQFSVDYDSARSTIVVKTGNAYTSAGGELATGTDKSSTAAASAQSIEIDGKKADLSAYNIGGNNFFKLRDLGTALGFGVDYDSATGTMIVKSK